MIDMRQYIKDSDSMAGFAPVEKLSLGAILGKTLTILTCRPQFFFGLAFLESLSGLFLLFWVVTCAPVMSWRSVSELVFSLSFAPVTGWGGSKLVFLIWILWNLVCQGAFAHSVFRFLRDNGTPGLGEALGLGFLRLPSLFLAMSLFSLPLGMIFGLSFGFVLFGAGTGKLEDALFYDAVSVVEVLTSASILLFCCLYGLFVQVCVIEGRGGQDSLRRSRALIKGHRLNILGLWMLFGLGFKILLGLAEAMTGFFSGSATVIAALTLILGCPFLAFYSVALTVVFHDLNILHEGRNNG